MGVKTESKRVASPESVHIYQLSVLVVSLMKKTWIISDCIDEENDPKGLYYNGTWSTTTSGRTCQEWSRLYPHSHAYREKLGKHRNYCRNINNLAHPWCYTTDPDKVWEYCATAPTCCKFIYHMKLLLFCSYCRVIKIIWLVVLGLAAL